MKKILLVEDDALLNKTLTYNLISEGYDLCSLIKSENPDTQVIFRYARAPGTGKRFL